MKYVGIVLFGCMTGSDVIGRVVVIVGPLFLIYFGR